MSNRKFRDRESRSPNVRSQALAKLEPYLRVLFPSPALHS